LLDLFNIGEPFPAATALMRSEDPQLRARVSHLPFYMELFATRQGQTAPHALGTRPLGSWHLVAQSRNVALSLSAAALRAY